MRAVSIPARLPNPENTTSSPLPHHLRRIKTLPAVFPPTVPPCYRPLGGPIRLLRLISFTVIRAAYCARFAAWITSPHSSTSLSIALLRRSSSRTQDVTSSTHSPSASVMGEACSFCVHSHPRFRVRHAVVLLTPNRSMISSDRMLATGYRIVIPVELSPKPRRYRGHEPSVRLLLLGRSVVKSDCHNSPRLCVTVTTGRMLVLRFVRGILASFRDKTRIDCPHRGRCFHRFGLLAHRVRMRRNRQPGPASLPECPPRCIAGQAR